VGIYFFKMKTVPRQNFSLLRVGGPSKGVVISPGGPNLGITEGIPGPTTEPLLLGILVPFSTEQR
jgi:hypothetical protein